MKPPKGLTKEERRKWFKDNKQTDIPTICLEKKCRKEFLRKSVGYCKRCPECQKIIKDKKNMSKKEKSKNNMIINTHEQKLEKNLENKLE
jgi:hypothetical protein